MSYISKVIADKTPFIVGTLRMAANLSGAFAPSIGENIGAVADRVDGTVGGVEKTLVEAWRETLFMQARIEGYNPDELLGTRSGVRELGHIHEELLEEAKKNQAKGMSRIAAQTLVVERRQIHMGAIEHLLRIP